MNRFLTFVNLYVPPPFSLTHLDDMLQATGGNIFILGDFNLVADSAMDRLDAPPDAPVPLAGWLSTYGFQDVWHFCHPDTKEYSCYSETHKSLSRIDTVLAEGEGLELVQRLYIYPECLLTSLTVILKCINNVDQMIFISR